MTDSETHIRYLEFCRSLNAGPKDLDFFRRNKAIISVYDHVPLNIGEDYLVEIRNYFDTSKQILDWNKVKTLDSIGKPIRYYFKGVGLISPTMLRYAKTLLDFESIFDYSTFRNVCEIGVGFGGQSSLMIERWNLDSYTYYDLPEVLNLVENFLEISNPSSLEIAKFQDGRAPQLGNYDFVFSNYAFSELDRQTQIKYLESTILQSAHGYITWNNLGNFYHDAYSLADLLRIIPNSQITPEVPLTSKYNSVIIW